MAAVVAAASTELPVWAIIECLPSGEIASGARSACSSSDWSTPGERSPVRSASVDAGVELLDRAHLIVDGACVFGVLLAGGPDSVTGFPDTDSDPEHWAERAKLLDAHGARIIGGGAGTTEAHTDALARVLGAIHPSIPALARVR
jgi:5-methyltetrahydrofolate--homocysteine methyltransferase